ncbi:MAG TPA: hypothetical protein V6C72_11685, partial [Chroococcales cyanobacterium]
MNVSDCSYVAKQYETSEQQEANESRWPASASTNIELLIGPYRAGKTLNLVSQVIDHTRQNPFDEILVLVPSQRYQQLFEKRLAQALSAPVSNDEEQLKSGIFGLRIVNFYKLCQIILRRYGKPFKVVPEQVRPAIISQVLTELSESGKIKGLSPIVNFTGTFQALLDLIDEFERSALSSTDVLARLEKTAQCDSKYMELARIYDAYSRRLEELGFVDQKGLAFAAREALFDAAPSQWFGLVAVDGFDRFNALQLHVLSGMARHSRKLEILFDYLPPQKDPECEYAWKESSFNDLIRILGSKLRITEMTSRTPAEERLERAVKVSRFRAIDRQFEMEEIARRIKEKLVREKMRSDQFLVVVRDLKSYSALTA